jgi:hypothetical protein
VLVAAGLATLVGARPWVARPGEQPPEPPRGGRADPAAQVLLKEAAAGIPAWLQTRLWLRSHCADFVYESEGRYHAAPGGRFRLELQTQRGVTVRQLLVLHDGKRLWQAPRAEADSGAVAADPSGPFRGPGPLLRYLHDELTWVRVGNARHAGAECIELSGTWRPERCQALAPAGQPWPDHLPQRCRLLLDRATLWPCRLEWWGAATAKGGCRLLVELEFRQPVLDQPLTGAEATRLFTIPKGDPERDARPAASRPAFGAVGIDG